MKAEFEVLKDVTDIVAQPVLYKTNESVLLVYCINVPKLLQLADTDEVAEPVILKLTGTVTVGVAGSFEFKTTLLVYVPAAKFVALNV